MTVVPAHLSHLPVRRGLPVPHVAAWSSEVWADIRIDPLIGKPAVFSAGRQGLGEPVFGIMNEARQRRSVMAFRCQVCDADLCDAGLVALVNPQTGHPGPWGPIPLQVTTEPPCCPPCLDWSLEHCPGLRDEPPAAIEPSRRAFPIAQLINPLAGPAKRADRFAPVTRAHRRRLERGMARHPDGVVGYIKLGIPSSSRTSP